MRVRLQNVTQRVRLLTPVPGPVAKWLRQLSAKLRSWVRFPAGPPNTFLSMRLTRLASAGRFLLSSYGRRTFHVFGVAPEAERSLTEEIFRSNILVLPPLSDDVARQLIFSPTGKRPL